MPRSKILQLAFTPAVNDHRKHFGHHLREQLHGFLVNIHASEPVIQLIKLITDEEIEANQGFFECCARDYKALATKLIYLVAEKLDITIDPEHLLSTFNKCKFDERKRGEIGEWFYYLHGFHCGFRNIKTGQLVEASLVFGLEFGELDPYFFSKYIKSTPEYRPLQVSIYEDYEDGVRINEKMLALGKFEKISNNLKHSGVVVTIPSSQ